ncbi:hypothetical protein SAMN04488023_109130 [Pedobacter rhizosphaerae]|uniref:Uncharacterized protein n=1 Tax=Pedobacter rhizosphaerae TaxID=390241 RepID=A0A1H9PCB4_9SPHI|nr:hypothetical protein SAMN04488023_109130 [Pedobacter rhizosphaerae]
MSKLLNERIKEELNDNALKNKPQCHSLTQNSIIIFSQTVPLPIRRSVYDQRI